jgi:hypothetical protein
MKPTIREQVQRLRGGRRHRVLVVIGEACPSSELGAAIRRRAARRPVVAMVIAPARGSSVTQWYVDEDAARADAACRLRRCVACLMSDGIRAEGRLAHPDPEQAIAAALRSFAADEILLVTAPERPSTWLSQDVIARVRRSVHRPVEQMIVPAGEFGR